MPKANSSKDELKKALTEASRIIKTKDKPSDSANLLAQEQAKTIEEWKNQRQPLVVFSEFETARHLLNLTIQGHTTATILTGEGGIGKTYLSVETVKESTYSNQWEYRSGFTTPLALYKFLYHNRDKRILILDDVEGLFDNPKSTALLKGALWDTAGKRLVQYDSTSDKAEGLPSVFTLQARLVILCNRIPNLDDPNISALLSRAITYEVALSHEQKLAIMEEILKARKNLSEKEKKLVMQIIRDNTSIATRHLNLRTMEKLVAYIKYDKSIAHDLFKQTTDTDEDMQTVVDILASGCSVEQQIKKFTDKTGRSRRTFFRIKKRIKLLSAKVPTKTNGTGGTSAKNTKQAR